MRLVITLTGIAGPTVWSDVWHLPNDLFHWLTPGLSGEMRSWTGSALPVGVPDQFAADLLDGGQQLEVHWAVEPCSCLRCQMSAKQQNQRRGGVESHG